MADRNRRSVLGFSGLALTLIVGANLGLPLSGAYLAIDMLLVVLGFEMARTVRESGQRRDWLQHFWLTTTARIGAPLFLALGLVAAYWNWQGQFEDSKIQALFGAMTMTLNLFMIFGRAQSMAIEHLWLIGVVFQFLVVLPLLVVTVRRRLRPETHAALLAALAAAVALVRLALLTVTDVAAHSVEINTVTRMDGLLLGAAIGVAPLSGLRRWLSGQLAPAALAVLVLLAVLTPGTTTAPAVTLGLLIPTVIVLAAVVTGSLVVGQTGAAVATILNYPLFRWLGERVFSIYSLFGFALQADGLGPAQAFDHWPGLVVFVMRLVFSLAAAAASRRYLELPAVAVAKQINDSLRSRRPRSRTKPSGQSPSDSRPVSDSSALSDSNAVSDSQTPGKPQPLGDSQAPKHFQTSGGAQTPNGAPTERAAALPDSTQWPPPDLASLSPNPGNVALMESRALHPTALTSTAALNDRRPSAERR